MSGQKMLILCVSFVTLSCGSAEEGATPTSNDAPPEASVISQGDFGGVNGKEASGLAQVLVAQNGELIVRIESLNVTAGPSLQVVGKASGEALYTAALKANTGNQNYYTGLSGTKTWTSIHIQSAAEPPPSNDYGVAPLTAIDPTSNF